MATTCPYCWQEITGTVSVEHLIPKDIGGNLEIPTCEPCNNIAGKYVDNPILRLAQVVTRKAQYDVRNLRRPRRRAKSEIVGTLSIGGGRTIWTSDNRESVFRQVEPAEPVVNVDGTLTFIVPEARSADHLQAAIDRYEAEHPGARVQIQAEDPDAQPVFEFRSPMAPWAWPRFAAKVAVGTAFLCMPDEWHRSDAAGMLVALFRTGNYYKGMFPAGYQPASFPDALDAAADEYDVLMPHEHVLYAEPVAGGMSFSGVLFGELPFGIQVVTDLQPDNGPTAWLLDGQGKAKPEPLNALIDRLGPRRDEFGGMRKLRKPPPRRFVGRVHHATVNVALTVSRDAGCALSGEHHSSSLARE
jgi:hypothetical protein